jgi:hypothetical protein
MNYGETLLAVYEPLPAWLDFLAMAGGLLLGAVGVLIWLVMFRKRRKRKYRQHQHDERKLNPTLAESGGLPPKKTDAPAPPP